MTEDSDRMPPAVSRERWLQAQRWELEFWNRQNIPSPLWKRSLRPLLVIAGLRPRLEPADRDDRNHWWRDQFDGYRMLPGEIENVVELGCGPYTNVRLVREGRRIGSITCSDPLAPHYVRYPHGWLADAVGQGIVAVDHHPIEECPFATDYFGLTIMTNVLDHVRDAARCIGEAMRITAPGGYLVLGQDLTSQEEKQPSNPGHPFVLSHHQILPLLDREFEPVLSRIIPRGEMSEPEMHYGALAYVGRKRIGPGTA